MKNVYSPPQMAREQCANFVRLEHPPTEGCIEPPNNEIKEGDCLLNDEKGVCPYFEKSVLPLAKRMPKYAGVPETYYGRAARVMPKDYEGRRCQCGAPLEPRMRFCSDCRKAHQRESSRRSSRKSRLPVTT